MGNFVKNGYNLQSETPRTVMKKAQFSKLERFVVGICYPCYNELR